MNVLRNLIDEKIARHIEDQSISFTQQEQNR